MLYTLSIYNLNKEVTILAARMIVLAALFVYFGFENIHFHLFTEYIFSLGDCNRKLQMSTNKNKETYKLHTVHITCHREKDKFHPSPTCSSAHKTILQQKGHWYKKSAWTLPEKSLGVAPVHRS